MCSDSIKNIISIEKIKEIFNLLKMHRIFIDEPIQLIKNIHDNINIILNLNNEPQCSDILDNFNIKIANTLLLDDQDECFKNYVQVIHFLKMNNINININPFDSYYEKKYINRYCTKNLFNVLDIVTNDNMDSLIKFYNFKYFSNSTQLYTLLDSNYNLIISFKYFETNIISEYLDNFDNCNSSFSHIIDKANIYLNNNNSYLNLNSFKYKNACIHNGYYNEIFNDYNNQNLIYFLMDIVEQYINLKEPKGKIIITGHSRGGAISIIMSLLIKEFLNLKKSNINLNIVATGISALGNKKFIGIYKKIIINDNKCALYKIVRDGDFFLSLTNSLLGFSPMRYEFIINQNAQPSINKTCIGQDLSYFIKNSFKSVTCSLNNIFGNTFDIIDDHNFISYYIDIMKYIQKYDFD